MTIKPDCDTHVKKSNKGIAKTERNFIFSERWTATTHFLQGLKVKYVIIKSHELTALLGTHSSSELHLAIKWPLVFLSCLYPKELKKSAISMALCNLEERT